MLLPVQLVRRLEIRARPVDPMPLRWRRKAVQQSCSGLHIVRHVFDGRRWTIKNVASRRRRVHRRCRDNRAKGGTYGPDNCYASYELVHDAILAWILQHLNLSIVVSLLVSSKSFLGGLLTFAVCVPKSTFSSAWLNYFRFAWGSSMSNGVWKHAVPWM